MQLIDRDNFNFELRIETLDDLWVLSQFIVPGDKVFATTERKVKIGNDNTKQVKKIIFVDLKVNKTSFENTVLRVSGEICNETEFTAIGQSHSLSFGINDSIKILKSSLLKFEEKMLNSAIESKKSKNLLVLLDKDEMIVSEFSNFNFSVLFEKKGLGSKKYVHTEINEEEEKFKILEEFLKRDYSNVIFSGPGLWKDKLSKYINDKIGLKSIVFAFSDVSTTAVSRSIKSIVSKGVLVDSELAKESKYMNNLLMNINSGSKFCYGEKNTFEAIESGSVEVFLISTKFIDSARENGTYSKINDLMRLVEQLNGDLVIINSKNEYGKQLDGLGSVAAILRY